MGRAKLYDPQAALSAIKETFWVEGFEGTSLQDLEATTGLPKQTLYREFGDKRQMYLKALGDYERTEIRQAAQTLASFSNAQDAFEALFRTIIDEAEASNGRRGCFLCNASADRTIVDQEVDAKVTNMLERWRKTFESTLNRTQQAEELSDTLLAGYIGLRILVRTGLPVSRLRAISGQLLTLIPRNGAVSLTRTCLH